MGLPYLKLEVELLTVGIEDQPVVGGWAARHPSHDRLLAHGDVDVSKEGIESTTTTHSPKSRAVLGLSVSPGPSEFSITYAELGDAVDARAVSSVIVSGEAWST